ncbi:P-loop containing nucleoside triphosphate hydrolase protein [Scheffersomyces coipomensis]|uniref:P-loop containing nucleoside triphosphate hydrolase protein n=1 Tax=Scheffersomyces coipomensis TaxID=1788519 RepID=UPI00315DE7BE
MWRSPSRLILRNNGCRSIISRAFISIETSHPPTIYALSTKYAKSAIGVIRITGSQSSYIYKQLTKSTKDPKAKLTSVRKLYSPDTNVSLDEALTIFFKSPRTYTGEDLLELHLHGGTAIIKSVLKAIGNLHDVNNDIHIRYAENGEFSKRAFINGRFDLTEIEGIRDMIDAETESQRIASLSSLTGQNRSHFLKWREDIVNNVALLTTLIDFGEDHDIEEVEQLFSTVSENIDKLQTEVQDYLRKVKSSEILLKGIRLGLIGPPNAGKSSLLNILANKDAAIVSEIAGTTRDIIDVPIDISGYKVIVGDTAGIRAMSTATDVIEEEGIRRAKDYSLSSDIVVIVRPVNLFEKDESDLVKHINKLKELNKTIIVVLNKEDLRDPTLSKEELIRAHSEMLDIPVENFQLVSCSTGNGIPELNNELINLFKMLSLSDSADPIVISSRAQDILEKDVLNGFEQFHYWRDQEDVVLASESLKQSVEGIGKITGDSVGIEEILGVVFSSFCIGK